MQAAKGLPQGESLRAPSVLLLDETGAEDDCALHLAWRSWLHLFNTVQALPSAWLDTAQGLEQHDYDGLNPSPTSAAAVHEGHNAFLQHAQLLGKKRGQRRETNPGVGRNWFKR